MTWCPADDAQICEECGALIADGYRPEHTRFHEVVTSLSLDALKGLKEPEPTPASVHAMRRRVERDENQFAWLHQCGHLNHGYWDDRSVCGGCRFSVEKADEVDGHYRLVPVEGLGDEERAE